MAPRKLASSVSVTRPQTEDEGSVMSETESNIRSRKGAAGKQNNSKVSKKEVEIEPEAKAGEDEDADSMAEGSDAEDVDDDDGDDDQEGEVEDGSDEEQVGDDDDVMGEDQIAAKPRVPSVAQKSFKSTKKPLGKASGTGKSSVRKRLEMELAPAAVRRRILQERFTQATSQATGVFLAAAMETFMRELIDTAVSAAQERKGAKPGKVKLTVQDIQKAVRMDEEFANIFQNVMFATHSVKALEVVTQSKTKGKKAAVAQDDD